MIEVRFHFGHLDRIPRCTVTRLAVPFCSHCIPNPPQGVANCQDDNGSTPADHLSFHSSEIDRA